MTTTPFQAVRQEPGISCGNSDQADQEFDPYEHDHADSRTRSGTFKVNHLAAGCTLLTYP
jgi:hypothetical protein